MKTIYLNGRYLRPEQANISVYDRGFLFGDSVYEVIARINGQFLDLEDHMKRLYNSLQALKIPDPQINIENMLSELTRRNGMSEKDGLIYLHISRGESKPRSHAFTKSSPTVFCDINLANFPKYDRFSRFKVITHPDHRWSQCHIKSTNLIPNTVAYNQALENDAVEAILHRDGQIVEGSKSNVFIVKNNIVMTPPLRNYMLGGTVRKRTLQLLHQLKIPHHESNISVDELLKADEVWITSTSRLINPITQIDDHILTRENFGFIWQRVSDAFHKQLKQTSTSHV
tara:strand:- start:1409 stop:2263 length:855 start_codon:yes stop_codon:yes gene_type:complete